MLLTNSKINRQGYKFSKYFRLKQAVKSRTSSRPRPRIQRSLLTRLEQQTHPRPCMTKLGPDDCFDWVLVSIPELTAAINDTTLDTFEDIPDKHHTK